MTPLFTPVPGTKHRKVTFCRVCGCRSLTELSEVPGTSMEVLKKSQKFRVSYGSLT